MCSHYQSVNNPQHLKTYFGVEPPLDSGRLDMWPGYLGAFVRRHEFSDVGNEAVSERQALATPEQSPAFFHQFPADALRASQL